MKRLTLMFTIMLAVMFVGSVSAIEYSGTVGGGVFPGHNEFDQGGNAAPETFRYTLYGEVKVEVWKGIFIYGAGDFYFGNVIPGQGGNGNDSWRMTPGVANVKGGVGYDITDKWLVALEGRRVLDLGEWYDGDKYKAAMIKTEYRFGSK